LLKDVAGLAFPVFERVAVVLGVDVHLFRQEQTSKEGLPVHEHVIFFCVFAIVGVFNGQYVISEARNHEQLLVNGVHVADGA
jgi:hypothetical protein